MVAEPNKDTSKGQPDLRITNKKCCWYTLIVKITNVVGLLVANTQSGSLETGSITLGSSVGVGSIKLGCRKHKAWVQEI